MPLSNIDRIEADLNGQDLCIGIVQARFNTPICEALTEACVKELLALGVAEPDIVITTVPGALEIPLALQKLTESGEFDALIALGAVIRGETYHFELVSNESGAGISRVGLDYGIPIANGVLLVRQMRKLKHAFLKKAVTVLALLLKWPTSRLA